MYYRSLCVVFLSVIVLSVIFTDSDYPFVIFKILLFHFEIFSIDSSLVVYSKMTFRNAGISLFSHLIKKIVYWLGSMFGVGDTKYMREAC